MSEPPPRTRLPALGARGEGWVIGQFALLGLVLVAGWPPTFPVPPASVADWLRLLGGGGALLGAGWLGTSAARRLGPSLTPLPHPRDGAELVEAGIYARIRHPIYAALIAGAAGWALLAGSPLAGLATLALAAFMDAKSRREEAWLSSRYPAYAEYRRRTRRFVPGIY